MKLIACLLLFVSTAHADYFDTIARRDQYKRQVAAAESQTRWARTRDEHNAELYAGVRRFAASRGGEPLDVVPRTRENGFILDDEFVTSMTFTTQDGYQCVARNWASIVVNCIHPTTGKEIGFGKEPPFTFGESKKRGPRTLRKQRN